MDGAAVFFGDRPGQLPTGDQSVFSGIDVRVGVFDYDYVNDAAPEYVRGEVQEPPLDFAMMSSIEINGGTADRRVPGLSVFVDGVEAPEVGNAGSPQRFTFQHQLEETVRGQRTLLEIRYQGASFSVGAVPLDVELTSPAAGATVTVNGPLPIRWASLQAEPFDFYVDGGRGVDCASPFTTVSIGSTEATIAPADAALASAGAAPCPMEITAQWLLDDGPFPGSPFRSLRVERSTRRILRFSTP